MNNPLGVSPSKGNQGTTRGKEKMVGIEPTTSGLDLPLLCHESIRHMDFHKGRESNADTVINLIPPAIFAGFTLDNA